MRNDVFAINISES